MNLKKAKHVKVGDKINLVIRHDSEGESVEDFCAVIAIGRVRLNGVVFKNFLVRYEGKTFWSQNFSRNQLISFW